VLKETPDIVTCTKTTYYDTMNNNGSRFALSAEVRKPIPLGVLVRKHDKTEPNPPHSIKPDSGHVPSTAQNGN